MPDTITLLGSLAGLDMQAVVWQPVWVRVHYAANGKLLGGAAPPGTILGEPGYAPTGYGPARSLVTDEQGLFGGVLPWEDGGIYEVAVPGDVTRFLVMGSGAGEYPAGSTVNVRLLPGPDEVVTPSVTLDALVGEAVEEYLTAHPPTGGGGVTDHGALTGLADDDHPQYALDADVTTALAGKVGLTDIRLTDARTPTAHAASHAAGGSDPVTVTSAQLADLTETVQDIVAALIAAGAGISKSYDDATGTLTLTATAGGGTTDPEIVRDTIGGALVQGAGITITVNDAADTITIASTAVLPTRQVATGTGLTGGGDLSVDRTLAVDFVASGAPSASKAVRADDSRLSDARTPVAHTHPAAQVSDSTAVGRSVLTAADAATARAAIGAGTSDLGAHKATHAAGGSDAVTLTNLAAGGTSPVRRLRAASNGSLSWVEPLFARKAADQQYLNTAALADVTDLGIDLEADSVYVGSAQITYFTGATSVKCSLGWTLPAGATMSWAANGISSAATTVAASIGRANLTGAQSQNVGSAGASAIDAHPTFIIMTGATAGQLQLQAAQGTADAVNALTIKANSWLRAERVV